VKNFQESTLPTKSYSLSKDDLWGKGRWGRVSLSQLGKVKGSNGRKKGERDRKGNARIGGKKFEGTYLCF